MSIVSKKQMLPSHNAAKSDTTPTSDMMPFLTPLTAARYRHGPRSARFLLLGICATFLVFFVWSAFAELEETVRAQGKIIPVQRVQHIQNLEGGILREILVSEGELVSKDTLLLRIDNEHASSVFRDATNKSLELQADIAIREAAISGKAPEFPHEVREKHAELIPQYTALLEAKRTEKDSERSALAGQLVQRRQEAKELAAKLANVTSALPFAIRQRDLAKRLLASKSYSEMEYLNLEQKVKALEGEITTLQTSLPRIQSTISEAEDRLRLHKAQSDTENMQAITRSKAELASLREMLVAGEDKVKRTDVRSPVRGVVKRINITTAGGVIMPGDIIMDIVPIDDTLIVEAAVSPQDIAFLFVGQPAKVRLTSYDFSIYGAMDAKLEHISADTMEGKNGDIFYLVKLRTETANLTHNGATLAILPGMQATVDIITGKKSVLSYLVKPILKAKQAALRER